MHGNGIFRWNDGRVYEGQFINDRKEGYGILTWPDNRKYEGSWVNGKQDGYGWFTSSSGIRQQGNWVEGKVQWWLDDKGERVSTHISQTEEAPP